MAMRVGCRLRLPQSKERCSRHCLAMVTSIPTVPNEAKQHDPKSSPLPPRSSEAFIVHPTDALFWEAASANENVLIGTGVGAFDRIAHLSVFKSIKSTREYLRRRPSVAFSRKSTTNATIAVPPRRASHPQHQQQHRQQQQHHLFIL